ncbi:MAG TPA: hypothetical protein VGG86_20735 [Roseiarcus sp.]
MLLEAELARRVAQAEWDAGQKERDWERLWGELAAMGQRMPAVTPPIAPGFRGALIELAEQFVRAKDWARVDEISDPGRPGAHRGHGVGVGGEPGGGNAAAGRIRPHAAWTRLKNGPIRDFGEMC